MLVEDIVTAGDNDGRRLFQVRRDLIVEELGLDLILLGEHNQNTPKYD